MQVVCCGWREFPLPLFGRTARKPHPLPESACLHPGSTLQLFLRMPLGASRHAVHLPINYQVLTTNTQQKCCMNLRALFLKLRATQRFHHVPLKATNAPEPKRRSNSSHLCRDIPPPHLGLLTDPWFLFSCLVAGTPSHPNMSQNKLPQHLLLQMALQFRRIFTATPESFARGTSHCPGTGAIRFYYLFPAGAPHPCQDPSN